MSHAVPREKVHTRPPAHRVPLEAFSLLELLVVIAVLGILAAMTSLAISSLSQSTKLTIGGNLAVDLINNARQVARTRNTMTMVAMVSSGADTGRALAILVFSATNGTNGSWLQIDKWRTLPEGITIETNNNFFQPPPASAVPISRAGAATDCVSAVFLPDGRPLSASSVPLVLIVKSAGPEASRTNNYYKIIMNQATGIPAIRRP